jgi:hypothetical protein
MRLAGHCFCRTCQHISGGAGNTFIVVDAAGFRYTSGTPKSFVHPDHSESPTRGFCERCGVHLTARSAKAEGVVLIKVGTLDDPSVVQRLQVVVWTSEMQPFQCVPEGVAAFPRFPEKST